MLRKLIAIGICSLALGVTLLIVYARRPPLSTNYERGGAEQSSQSRIEAELLVLRSDGFHTREIRRPSGKFLAIQNHTSEEEPSFVLSRGAGESFRQIRVSKRIGKYRELIELPPGTYVLTETNHSDWTCKIVIEQ